MLSLVKGVEPRDQVEAMIAAQMAAVHMATMTFACRLAHVENIPQQDSSERAFNKLARTFTAQVEALAIPNRGRAKDHRGPHESPNCQRARRQAPNPSSPTTSRTGAAFRAPCAASITCAVGSPERAATSACNEFANSA
jgi:hypothetical protein